MNFKITPTFNIHKDLNFSNPAKQLQICGSRTVLDVVEDDELLPAQLLHQSQHDVVEADGRPGSQRVALPAGTRVELAGGPRRALAVPLDVQVRDVHGVRQGLQRAGRRAARRGDQRQYSLVHQLAGWKGEGEKGEKGEKGGRFELFNVRDNNYTIKTAADVTEDKSTLSGMGTNK